MIIDAINSCGISLEALTGIEKFWFIAEQKKALANPVDSSKLLHEYLAEQEHQRKIIADILEPPYMREMRKKEVNHQKQRKIFNYRQHKAKIRMIIKNLAVLLSQGFLLLKKDDINIVINSTYTIDIEHFNIAAELF
jgi:cell fate (sporulation/competence/biofilm development) regulator YlbF (YheA/YmcA/DUF963 family)